jgi:hypothetical protein
VFSIATGSLCVNLARFPDDSMFQLSAEEFATLLPVSHTYTATGQPAPG